MQEKGFIKLHRKIFNNPFFRERRVFSNFEAWLDLIQQTRWKDTEGKVLINGKMIYFERGQIVASVRFLAERWNWSRGRVEKYLTLLIREEMVQIDNSEGIQRITLCNFAAYNDGFTDEIEENDDQKRHPQQGLTYDYEIRYEYDENEKKTPRRHREDTEKTGVEPERRQPSNEETKTYKEVEDTEKTGGSENISEKKTKQEEKKNRRTKENIYIAKLQFAETVWLKEAEYNKLLEKHGLSKTNKFIEKLNSYKKQKGKTYKSDYDAILNWVVQAILDDEVRELKREKEKNAINRSGYKDNRGKGAISAEQIDGLNAAYGIQKTGAVPDQHIDNARIGSPLLPN